MGIPDHPTCLLRNLYAGEEATVRTRHGIMNWFKIGKGGQQGCILSPCLFNFYAELVQFSHSVVSDSLQSRGLQLARPSCPSPTPGVMSIESVMPSSHVILCCSLLLPPSIFPSIRVFSKESVLHIRWPKYWSFNFSISPSNDSGLISSRMDWLDLLAVQGTLKSVLQHNSSKASILWRSAFFIVQLSHP